MSEHRDKRDRETHDGTRPDKPPRRPGTHADDRDYQPPKSQPFGVPITPPLRDAPEDFERPITNVDMEPLEAIEERVKRVQRTTDAAATSIAGKVEEHGKDIRELKSAVGTIGIDVAGIRGEMKVLPALVDALKDAAKAGQERKTTTLTSELRIVEATANDELDSRKAKRKNWATIIGALFSTATITAAITYAAGGHC